MKAILQIALALCPILLFAQPTSQTFTSSGTWVCPPNYTANITVEAWGGGGSGGTGTGRQGGGGGGAYSSSTFDVSEGSYTVTVGAGGVSGAGGPSSFGAFVVALGGGTSASSTGS
ncbi:MAG: hypothetical protein MUC59_08575, partial [Saprospiraceae bacterium]|nr:hypothetical protein [Saprospiraceae bacterium]